MPTISEEELTQIRELQARLDEANAKVAQLSGGLVAEEKQGFAECLTLECEEYKALKPIPVRTEVVEKRYDPGAGGIRGIESSTKYVLAVNDSDMHCPACGGPRSVLEDAPRKIPKGF